MEQSPAVLAFAPLSACHNASLAEIDIIGRQRSGRYGKQGNCEFEKRIWTQEIGNHRRARDSYGQRQNSSFIPLVLRQFQVAADTAAICLP
jgi:hypothetical protein